jgi:homocitrate synthase
MHDVILADDGSATGDRLGLNMTDAQIKLCTIMIKTMADVRNLAAEETNSITTALYSNLNSE